VTEIRKGRETRMTALRAYFNFSITSGGKKSASTCCMYVCSGDQVQLGFSGKQVPFFVQLLQQMRHFLIKNLTKIATKLEITPKVSTILLLKKQLHSRNSLNSKLISPINLKRLIFWVFFRRKNNQIINKKARYILLTIYQIPCNITQK